MNNFLTPEQIAKLEGQWEVKPECFYIILYKDEMSLSAWESLCERTNKPLKCNAIKILSIAVAE